METYILFLYGKFDDIEDIEFFSLDIMGDIESISDIRYVIQNLQNIIVIFTSKENKKTLNDEIEKVLKIEQVSHYFMFKINNVELFSLPETLNDIIFKPQKFFNYELNKNFDLDEILDKISKNGLDSISEEEKKFLDSFGL